MSTPYRIHGFPKPPLVAGADLSANGFRFVKAGAAEGQALPIAAVADRPMAVQQDKPRAGEAGDFVSFGIVEIETGAVVAFGAEISTDATGRAVPAVSGRSICGWALTSSGAAGHRISAFINLVNPPRMA